MSDEFQTYLEQLADQLQGKSEAFKHDARHRIMVHGGVLLNWMGDYLGNEDMRWGKQTLSVAEIEMSGTTPEWNEIFIERCERDLLKLRQMMDEDGKLRARVTEWASESRAGAMPILVRRDGDRYKVLDGMHRLVGLVASGVDEVEVFYPENETEVLPVCEPHVVYDLIRGYQRHARDEVGQEDLYHALKLLVRSYANVKSLLQERFNEKWIADDAVQQVIQRVLTEGE